MALPAIGLVARAIIAAAPREIPNLIKKYGKEAFLKANKELAKRDDALEELMKTKSPKGEAYESLLKARDTAERSTRIGRNARLAKEWRDKNPNMELAETPLKFKDGGKVSTPEVSITINNNNGSEGKKEKAGGGLLTPREEYGVGSLATKGVMKALKQRSKFKTDPKIDRVEDPIDPSLLKKIEDFEPEQQSLLTTPESTIPKDPDVEAFESDVFDEELDEIKEAVVTHANTLASQEEYGDALFRSLEYTMDGLIPPSEMTNEQLRKVVTTVKDGLIENRGEESFYDMGMITDRGQIDFDQVDDYVTEEALSILSPFFDQIRYSDKTGFMIDYNIKGTEPRPKTKINLEPDEFSIDDEPLLMDSIVRTLEANDNDFSEIRELVPNINSLSDDGYNNLLEIIEETLMQNEEALKDSPFADRYKPGNFEDIALDILENIINTRTQKQEGGEMAMPPELMQQDVPVDTYPNMTPEEEAMPIASDEQMQEDYVDYVTAEVLTPVEQDYLNTALDNDPQLESILDKVVTYATEFTGEGEVEGPGTGISDSIPARLSDGEFVITEKATDEIGANNLQTMMDEAERAADGGMMQRYALGGAVDNPILGGAVKDTTPLMDEKTDMYGTTRQDDEMKKQMMYANRMPSIIGR